MKRIVWAKDKTLIAMICVCALGAAAALAPDTLAKLYFRIVYARQPHVHVSAPSPDWGTMAEGELIRHVFRVENRGGQPLLFPPDPFA